MNIVATTVVCRKNSLPLISKYMLQTIGQPRNTHYLSEWQYIDAEGYPKTTKIWEHQYASGTEYHIKIPNIELFAHLPSFLEEHGFIERKRVSSNGRIPRGYHDELPYVKGNEERFFMVHKKPTSEELVHFDIPTPCPYINRVEISQRHNCSDLLYQYKYVDSEVVCISVVASKKGNDLPLVYPETVSYHRDFEAGKKDPRRYETYTVSYQKSSVPDYWLTMLVQPNLADFIAFNIRDTIDVHLTVLDIVEDTNSIHITFEYISYEGQIQRWIDHHNGLSDLRGWADQGKEPQTYPHYMDIEGYEWAMSDDWDCDYWTVREKIAVTA